MKLIFSYEQFCGPVERSVVKKTHVLSVEHAIIVRRLVLPYTFTWLNANWTALITYYYRVGTAGIRALDLRTLVGGRAKRREGATKEYKAQQPQCSFCRLQVVQHCISINTG